MRLLLASSSPIRKTMLRKAGLTFGIVPADIDEDALKRAHEPASITARRLAEAKAEAVSRDHPDAWVIGSDSIVEVDETGYSKPSSREQAEAHLRSFSGNEMLLCSAVALARQGRTDWSTADEAHLAVRDLSDSFIAEYLDCEWPEVAGCVGVFRMEGRGIQLFDRVRGSHFTILGMPLLPLLAALRERGQLTS